MASDEQILEQYEQEMLRAQQAQAQANAMPYANAMFSNNQKQNLVEWELDFKNELEDIERLLRCDVLQRDKDGQEYWIANPEKEKVFFNEQGVNDILRKIRMMVNKNKVLSYYTVDEITVRVRMIEHELRVLIYNNYEQYGMDNEYKQNNYSMIVLTVGSVVEDAYRRALNGETHKGLAEQRVVTQSEAIMGGGYNPMMPQQQTKGWKKALPWNWGK